MPSKIISSKLEHPKRISLEGMCLRDERIKFVIKSDMDKYQTHLCLLSFLRWDFLLYSIFIYFIIVPFDSALFICMTNKSLREAKKCVCADLLVRVLSTCQTAKS